VSQDLESAFPPLSSVPTPSPAGKLTEPQEAFVELGTLVVGKTSLSQVLARVAQLTQECVPGRRRSR
jgi:hypothetical protein